MIKNSGMMSTLPLQDYLFILTLTMVVYICTALKDFIAVGRTEAHLQILAVS
jgi:hypothetical protein